MSKAKPPEHIEDGHTTKRKPSAPTEGSVERTDPQSRGVGGQRLVTAVANFLEERGSIKLSHQGWISIFQIVCNQNVRGKDLTQRLNEVVAGAGGAAASLHSNEGTCAGTVFTWSQIYALAMCLSQWRSIILIVEMNTLFRADNEKLKV